MFQYLQYKSVTPVPLSRLTVFRRLQGHELQPDYRNRGCQRDRVTYPTDAVELNRDRATMLCVVSGWLFSSGFTHAPEYQRL